MILSALLESRASKLDAVHPSDGLPFIASSNTFAGVQVTPYNALQLSAVYACNRVLSESMAVLSADVFQRRSDGRGKDKVREHPASWLIREDANTETPAFNFRETLQGHLGTWGNGAAEIQIRGNGQPEGLWQKRPDRVSPERVAGGRLAYRVINDNGGERVVPADRMLYVSGFGFNGLRGFSPVQMQAQSVGTGMAVSRYRAAFFGNNTQLSGFVKHPASLDDGGEALLEGLEKMSKGPGNSFRMGVLDEGADWVSVGFPNDAAQLLETGRFQVTEVAGWYRLPPHLIGDLTHATFTNIEHQDLEFIKYSLLPWMRRWESELKRKLLSEAERRRGLFIEFNADTLLRGDFKTRMEGLAKAIETGQMSRNEARAIENRNPYDGGDEYTIPLNWQAASQLENVSAITERTAKDGTVETRVEFAAAERAALPLVVSTARETIRDLEPRAQRGLEARWRLEAAFERLLLDAAQRTVDRETTDIGREIARMPQIGSAAFREWLSEFYVRHEAFVRSAMGPVLLALMEAVSADALDEVGASEADFRADLEAFHAAYVDTLSQRQRIDGENQIIALLDAAATEAEAVEAVKQRLGQWGERRAGKVAGREASQSMNAITSAAYAFGGVTLLRWVWNGGECKICPELHGKVVEIGQPFVRAGDRLAEDAEDTQTFVVRRVRNHPPLHPPECRCSITPG